jgi:hypothetical protein
MEDNKVDRTRVREELIPRISNLYPMYFNQLKQVETLEELKDLLKGETELY